MILLTAILCALALGATGALAAETSPPVHIYDTHGTDDKAAWTILSGAPADVDPEHIVIENSIVRITYPCLKGVPGNTGEAWTEKAGHLLYLMLDGRYQLAQDKAFGDWTYVGGSFTDDPTNCAVLRNTDDIAEIVMDFPNHKDLDGHPNACRKHVTLHRGHHGYLLRIEEETTIPGEREGGFGNAASPIADCPDTQHFFAYTTHTAYLWSPTDPVPGRIQHYEFLRELNGSADWWAAGIAFKNSYYRLVGLKPQSPQSPTIRSGSFRHGYLSGLIRYRHPSMAETGYEVYVAVAPYDGTDAQNIVVDVNSASVTVPQAGRYTIFSEALTDPGGSKHYERVIDAVELKAGANTVDIADKTLKNPIIVPLANGRDFPEDLWQAYLTLP